MVDNTGLCERLEHLAGQVFRIIASETHCDRSAGKRPGSFQHTGGQKRREWLSRLRTYSLVAAEREMLGISRKLAESLDSGHISDVEQYVDDLSASRTRCRRAGIAFDAFLPMLSTSCRSSS